MSERATGTLLANPLTQMTFLSIEMSVVLYASVRV